VSDVLLAKYFPALADPQVSGVPRRHRGGCVQRHPSSALCRANPPQKSIKSWTRKAYVRPVPVPRGRYSPVHLAACCHQLHVAMTMGVEHLS
jgi:hypothetical protein